MPRKQSSQAWINQIFDAKITQKYGLARRNKSDVEKYASSESLKTSVKARGWHLIETGDQYVILCNPGSIIIHL